MKRVAILNNMSVVVSVAIADDIYDNPLWIDLTGLDPEPATGWAYENGVFTPPVEVPPAVVTVPRHISVGAFFDRFGDQKYPILASADASVKALIQDVSVRKYVDLDNAQLPIGLSLLVSAGFVIDPESIINGPISILERP